MEIRSMINYSEVLTREEIAVFKLRALYSEYGYARYRMSKFEEYDLYVKNKDFLVSDNIITFTDTDGRLLALKPDVTLSIIKNTKSSSHGISKMQYNENVYRIFGGTHTFKELMQSGLECIGSIGSEEISEVTYLAVRSLKSISESSLLIVSHLDVIEGLCEAYGISEDSENAILTCLGQRNSDEIKRILESGGATDEAQELISGLTMLYGDPDTVLKKLDKYRITERIGVAIDELCALTDDQKRRGTYESIKIDFSLVGDMKYYNGIAMKGFIEGIPTSILSGGRYDKLMRRMGRREGAIGFALYLDELERLPEVEIGKEPR